MTEKNKPVEGSDLSDAVDYVRNVHQFNSEWYKNADTKAEIILSLDGIFLTVVTGAIFMNQVDLVDISNKFTNWSWFFLGLMSLSLAGSILCTIACLWSRISLSQRTKEKYFVERKIEVDKPETYPPEATFFFQEISWLDPKLYQKLLLSVDKKFEIRALAADVHILAGNVLKKHQLVDFGFILAGASLLSFLAFGISYLIAITRL